LLEPQRIGGLHWSASKTAEPEDDAGRLRKDPNGKPLAFRDTMIGNIRSLVDVAPRLTIFGN